jgi:hypothetical protein
MLTASELSNWLSFMTLGVPNPNVVIYLTRLCLQAFFAQSAIPQAFPQRLMPNAS